MASGSPRTRIDQFYASKKKKKCLSPGLKSGKIQKDATITIEGSPSGKGSLDSYLVNSQDDNSPAKPLHTAHGSSPRHDLVKRNLGLKIGLSSKEETEEACSSTQGCYKISEAVREAEKEKSEVSSVVGDDIVRGLEKDCSDSLHSGGNTELKQFTADFLSFYCSELPSSASQPLEAQLNVHKRKGSPSVLDLGVASSKRRHCPTDGDQAHAEGEFICCTDKYPNNMQSDHIRKSGEAIFNSSSEEICGNGHTELQVSLRKCNKTSRATFPVMECDTPGPFIINSGARDTPKSTRGSSIFSPGETFWNEAIQVADGLFATSDNLSVKVAEEMKVLNRQDKIKSSTNMRNGDRGSKLNEVLNDGAIKVCDMEMSASLGSLGKQGKDSNKEVSPLPVKHFDFSREDKNLDEDTSYWCSGNDTKCLMLKEGEQKGCISVSNHNLETANITAHCSKAHINGDFHQVQEMTSNCAVANRKDAIGTQDSDHITSNTPDKGTGGFTAVLEYNEHTPSSFMPLKDRLDLSNWLPSEICSIYRKRGILKLYPWQVDCLQVDGVLEKRNLVYCASTSAGKSFVAEILMLRRVLSTGKMALLVLPYVSICAEKAEHLEALLEPLDKHVRSYYGNQGGGTLPKDTSVAVCTIEKANSLVNRLLEEGRLSEVGIIVIDELHMVGDQTRGYLLELMLTKLHYAAGEGTADSSSGESSGMSSGKSDPAHGLQIVGMSATLPNVVAIADWLHAALYQTDFRPVPLEEYIKVGNTIYNKKMDIVRTISKGAYLGGKDPDHIVELCNEVVQEGHSVLLFCSSRKGCESTARHVAKYLNKFSVASDNKQTEFTDITTTIDALRRSPAGLDPILEEILPAGVAYHHAGLTLEEREIVEACYRKGFVRVLTATSTLAAGVNLPARRVIFRQPRIGRDFIDGTRYRQMAGRAGRTGIDTKGESVLICKQEEVKRVLGLLNDSCPPLHSCLSEDKNGMIHAILEVVAGGIVQTANDIHRYVRCTLLNSTKPFEDVVKSAQDSLRWLCHRKFLEWSEDTKLYSTTPLGRAAFGSSLCPEESLVVLDDLSRAREGFVLASDLHLVYLVTPINVDLEPDWELYYERFMELSALDQLTYKELRKDTSCASHGIALFILLMTFKFSAIFRCSLFSASVNRCGLFNSSFDAICCLFVITTSLKSEVVQVPCVVDSELYGMQFL
ncbi:unnamed protein product [Ilex paraguariensis]|uniref:Helicase and polymerase-containing protein TEBICHI n=1 Tax=Ilex paraguariensis TaxID=185542 RepID=A0ABC8UNS4_9AQUA